MTGYWLLSSFCLFSLKCHCFSTTFHQQWKYAELNFGAWEKKHICFALWKSLSPFSWLWRAARNESNQEVIMLWAAEAAHMGLVMGAKGANPMARLASPQLFVAPWWWWRDSLCPGMSSTPQILHCEWQQYEACMSMSMSSMRQGKGHNLVLKLHAFWGLIMDLKEVVQRRGWPGKCVFLHFVKAFIRPWNKWALS